jgi:hypothetical protein
LSKNGDELLAWHRANMSRPDQITQAENMAISCAQQLRECVGRFPDDTTAASSTGFPEDTTAASSTWFREDTTAASSTWRPEDTTAASCTWTPGAWTGGCALW